MLAGCDVEECCLSEFKSVINEEDKRRLEVDHVGNLTWVSIVCTALRCTILYLIPGVVQV